MKYDLPLLLGSAKTRPMIKPPAEYKVRKLGLRNFPCVAGGGNLPAALSIPLKIVNWNYFLDRIIVR